jgi:hypothetical protein
MLKYTAETYDNSVSLGTFIPGCGGGGLVFLSGKNKWCTSGIARHMPASTSVLSDKLRDAR